MADHFDTDLRVLPVMRATRGLLRQDLGMRVRMRVQERMLAMGQRPLCNLQKSRAPHVAGVCLPLCSRCLGLLAGGCLAIFPWMAETMILIPEPIRWVMLVALPLDHLAGRFGLDPGSNLRRFLTGVVFSIGVGNDGCN